MNHHPSNADTHRRTACVHRADYYAQLLAERLRQLETDRRYYEAKLKDFSDLDPDNRTGLRRIFEAHVRHISDIMESLQRTAPAR